MLWEMVVPREKKAVIPQVPSHSLATPVTVQSITELSASCLAGSVSLDVFTPPIDTAVPDTSSKVDCCTVLDCDPSEKESAVAPSILKEQLLKLTLRDPCTCTAAGVRLHESQLKEVPAGPSSMHPACHCIYPEVLRSHVASLKATPVTTKSVRFLNSMSPMLCGSTACEGVADSARCCEHPQCHLRDALHRAFQRTAAARRLDARYAHAAAARC